MHTSCSWSEEDLRDAEMPGGTAERAAGGAVSVRVHLDNTLPAGAATTHRDRTQPETGNLPCGLTFGVSLL